MKSSTGLDENFAGALCYLLGFVTGLVFLLLEKESRFVRFHAMQSFIAFSGLWIAIYVLRFVPFIGWFACLALNVVGLFVWILCMAKAYQGRWFKLPIVGEIAESFAK